MKGLPQPYLLSSVTDIVWKGSNSKIDLAFHGLMNEMDLKVVIDIYDYDNPVHPQGHLGWWAFKLRPGTKTLSFSVEEDGQGLHVHSRSDLVLDGSWVNPEFKVSGKCLTLNYVLRDSGTNGIVFQGRIPAFETERARELRRSQTAWNFIGEVDKAWFVPSATTRVLIFAPNIFIGDAIGNFCIGLAELFKRSGIEAKLYANNYDLMNNDEIREGRRFFIDATKDDVVFYHYSIFDPHLSAIAKLPNRKIAYFHGITPPRLIQAFDPELARACKEALREVEHLAGFDCLATNSKESLEQLRSCLGGKKLKADVIVPRLDFSIGTIERGEGSDPVWLQDFESSTYRFITVGRVVSHKKIEDVIALFAEFARQHKGESSSLVIAGPETHRGYRHYLDWLIANRFEDVAHRIVFAGSVSESLKHRLYRSSSCYLCMSEHEGFCLPLLEAMEADLPVLAYGRPAIREVLGEVGTTFVEKDYPHLAKVLARLIERTPSSEFASMRRRGRLKAFEPDLQGRKILGLLEKVLFRKPIQSSEVKK
jgi:glycosyltransferase involved in cell wall biosynthesis